MQSRYSSKLPLSRCKYALYQVVESYGGISFKPSAAASYISLSNKGQKSAY
jgi:hypothetical protein